MVNSISDLFGQAFRIGDFTFIQGVYPSESWTVKHPYAETDGYGATIEEAVYELKACSDNPMLRAQISLFGLDEYGMFDKQKPGRAER